MELSDYIATKHVKATPMTRKEYSAFFEEQKSHNGFVIIKKEPGESDEDGYLVGYPEANGSFTGKLIFGCQHISWCPKHIFDASHRPFKGMSFGLAIEAMKKGYRVARAGWNGKDMFVVMQKGYPQGIPCNAQTAAAFGMKEGELFKCRPYLQLRCSDGSHQMWQPSVSDCLEEDWFII